MWNHAKIQWNSSNGQLHWFPDHTSTWYCIPFYHHLQGRIGFNTVNPSLSTGKDYLIHSPGKDWWWPYSTKIWELLYPCSIKTREVLGNPSPMPKRFPETRGQPEGNLEWKGGGFINISRVLVEYGHSIHHQGVHEIILPCRQGRIDSAMMIEWLVHAVTGVMFIAQCQLLER